MHAVRDDPDSANTRPAGKTEAFFELVWGLARDGKVDSTAGPTCCRAPCLRVRTGRNGGLPVRRMASSSWCSGCSPHSAACLATAPAIPDRDALRLARVGDEVDGGDPGNLGIYRCGKLGHKGLNRTVACQPFRPYTLRGQRSKALTLSGSCRIAVRTLSAGRPRRGSGVLPFGLAS
jgi:hypothetical protein